MAQLELADLVERILGDDEEDSAQANSLFLLKMALEPSSIELKPLVQALLAKAAERESAGTVRPVSPGEVRLAFKLRLCRLPLWPVDSSWVLQPLFDLIKSAHTSEDMKIALIEFLANYARSSHDTTSVLSFLVWLIKNEPLDKARACAVFAWANQRHRPQSLKEEDAREFLTGLWTTSGDGAPGAGDVVLPLGPLTEAALAIVTLRLVYRPPAAAVERVVALVQDSIQVQQAWVAVDGGESLVTEQQEPGPVPVTELVPEEHLPLVLEHIALHRQRKQEDVAQPISPVLGHGLTSEQLALLPDLMQRALAQQQTQPAAQEEPSLPVDWEDLELGQLAYSALSESDRCWAQPHARRCLLERLSGQADPEPTRRMLYCLLSMLMADPLPEEAGYYALELDPALVQVLNELAFNDRYDALWRVVEEELKAKEEEDDDEEKGERSAEPLQNNPFGLFGLPAHRSSMQAWLGTPLPPYLARRKRFPHLAGLEAFPWDSVQHAYGSATNLPAQIRSLVDSDQEQRKHALHCIGGTALHQGTYYSSTPLVAKWISAALAYEDTPDKADLVTFLILLARAPSHCNVLGFKGDERVTAQPLALATYREMKREPVIVRYLALQLLAMIVHDQGHVVVDDLLGLWRDHSERPALRIMALVVLSFVTPTTDDDAARRQFKSVVATLASLLPPPPGAVRSLADMAAVSATRPGSRAQTLKRKRGQGEKEEEDAPVAPAEVLELIAARSSLQPGSQAHAVAQFNAAKCLCRMLVRGLDVSSPEELEQKIRSGELQQLLSSRGLAQDVTRLVPAAQLALKVVPACPLHPGLGDDEQSATHRLEAIDQQSHQYNVLDGIRAMQLNVFRLVLDVFRTSE